MWSIIVGYSTFSSAHQSYAPQTLVWHYHTTSSAKRLLTASDLGSLVRSNLGRHNDMSTLRRARDAPAFLPAPTLPRCAPRGRGAICLVDGAAVDHVAAVGFPILEAFKGVFIGPTVNEVAAAVAGGTVGVMGTIIVLETGRQRALERKQCPYCRGTGKLPCGKCVTLGFVPAVNKVGAQKRCSRCKSGYLQCNHCEGEGRLIPIEYERAIRAQYEDYVYDSRADDYYQDGPPYV